MVPMSCSGSDTETPSRPCFFLMYRASCSLLHVRWASSNTTIRSCGALAVPKWSLRNMCIFCMNFSTAIISSFLVILGAPGPPRARSLLRLTPSRTSASCSTPTRYMLPDRNTESPSRLRFAPLAISIPASVLPAPGTPVTKHIDFAFLRRESSTTFSTSATVLARFSAPASFWRMSRTVCPMYSIRAASMIVGVGLYPARFQASASIGAAALDAAAPLTMSPRSPPLDLSTPATPRSHSTSPRAARAPAATSTGTTGAALLPAWKYFMYSA